jgi:hypothetical protein
MSVTIVPQDYITADDLQKFGRDLSKRIVDDMTDVLQAYVTHIDERFNKVEYQIEQVISQAGTITD